jgi:hypothetical protein
MAVRAAPFALLRMFFACSPFQSELEHSAEFELEYELRERFGWLAHRHPGLQSKSGPSLV